MFKWTLFTILSIIAITLVYLWPQTDTRMNEKLKEVVYPSWEVVFKNKPILTLLGQCEAPDGKGGIDLNAFNPEDIDGKEKWGPLQLDEETFYGGAIRFGLKDTLSEEPDIKNPYHQVWLTEQYISVHEYWRWPVCWMEKIFPR